MGKMMNTKKLFLGLLPMMASILFGIGPEAMTFPLDIRSMALSGTGAAGG